MDFNALFCFYVSVAECLMSNLLFTPTLCNLLFFCFQCFIIGNVLNNRGIILHGNSYPSRNLKTGKVDVKIFKSMYAVNNTIDFLGYVALVHILIIADSVFSSSII